MILAFVFLIMFGYGGFVVSILMASWFPVGIGMALCIGAMAVLERSLR